MYKTQKEIEVMAKGGRLLAEILNEVKNQVKPGVGTMELDNLAEKLILQNGGQPSFKNYQAMADQKPFPTTLCTSINDEVVHAPARPNRILKEGDIIGLDIGMEYQGGFTDMAVTVGAGKVSQEAANLMVTAEECLNLAIEQVKEGNFLSNIAKAIQSYAEENDFTVVRELVGHGVGQKVHEDPNVPNYVTEESKNIQLKKGMTIAIEPMVNSGGWRVKILDDGLTFATADGSLSAQFEHTVAIDHNGQTRILTKL
ncbi:MAG: type I methionyl aminopeptidase [Candidatus Parcubacteria bacterium]|nr:type I methionyl aminopeptidase [Candidatus Parcubacteria bacterium]